VWAEFSMHEGGVIPSVATSDAAPNVR
jgi:hypothetical protein